MDAARALFVKRAADIDQPQRGGEIQRAGMDEMVVFAKAQPERPLRLYSGFLQPLHVHVIGEEDADLHVAIAREYPEDCRRGNAGQDLRINMSDASATMRALPALSLVSFWIISG